METRKVQVTGGSSYVITLPKEWITSLKIKKKQQLGIITQPDGTLLITPKLSDEKIQRMKEIHVDETFTWDFLFRLLIGAYIMGFSYFKVVCTSRISPMVRDCVTNFTQTAIGPEIIEETINSITMKDLLNPLEMPFEKSIRRMTVLVRSMHEDVITALKRKDEALAEDIIARDREINRRHWLVARQSHQVLQDITIAQKMGVSLEDSNNYFLVSRQLERIGDHAVRIAKNTMKLLEEEVAADLIEAIAAASAQSLALLTDSLDSWDSNKISVANECIDQIGDLQKLCEKITQIDAGPEIDILALNYIAESIRRTGEYAGNIAEIVINSLIQD